jgi:glycerol-3-phosphate acyltransferase PlsY
MVDKSNGASKSKGCWFMLSDGENTGLNYNLRIGRKMMTIPLDAAAVISGYLLGSFPSAYLVGRLWGKVDLRQEGDGHISGMAAYRHFGRLALALVIAMDMAKGIMAVYIGTLLTDSQLVLIAVAYAAVIGHCWSIYIGFKGGLGGVVTFAVLASLALKEAFIGAGVFLIILLIFRKSSWGTYLLLGFASLALLIESQSIAMVLFPLGLIGIQLLKRWQTRKVVSQYKNEVWDDLKRVK